MVSSDLFSYGQRWLSSAIVLLMGDEPIKFGMVRFWTVQKRTIPFNFAWSLIFFGLHSIAGALFEIAILIC
jgi:tryptophan-rich sensory protein